MRFEKRVRLDAAPEVVWKFVSDPVRLGELSSRIEIEELDPRSAPGLGSRYRMVLDVGPSPLGSTVEVVAFTEPRDLAWVTVTGIDHRMRLMVRPRTDGGSHLTLRFSYDSPGVLGSLADVAAFVPVRAVMIDLVRRAVSAIDGP